MGSGVECLSDIRLKVLDAEDRLVVEQNNLYKLNQKHAKEREKWNEETAEIERIVHALEEDLKVKQERLAVAKEKLKEIFYKPRELEQELERIEKENKKIQREKEEEKSKNTEDIKLRKELEIIQQKRQEVLKSTRWMKEIQESEGLNINEGEGENKVKEEIKVLWKEIEKKMNVFDQTMRDIENTSLNSQKQRLQDLHECRSRLEADCEEMERKNKELEQKIKQLEEEEGEEKESNPKTN